MRLPAIDERPVCQYCGEPVEDRRVDCARCATPHHRECFVESGCCTTYACGCRSFTEPGETAPVEVPSTSAPAGPWRGVLLPPDLSPASGADPNLLAFHDEPWGWLVSVSILIPLLILPTWAWAVFGPQVAIFVAPAAWLLFRALLRTSTPGVVFVDPSQRRLVLFDDAAGRHLRRVVPFAQIVAVVARRHRKVDSELAQTVSIYLRERDMVLVRGWVRPTTDARLWGEALALITGRPLLETLEGEERLSMPHELRAKLKGA